MSESLGVVSEGVEGVESDGVRSVVVQKAGEDKSKEGVL